MRSQYAGTITPPAPTITFGNGSITDAKSGSYSAYLQGRNRAGVTAYSDRTLVEAELPIEHLLLQYYNYVRK